MSTTNFDRRQFLQAFGKAVAIATVAPGMLILTGPKVSWSYSLSALTEHQAATLLEMVRRLFPHVSLGEAYYALAVQSLDQTAYEDPSTAALLKHGINGLDALANGDWLKAKRDRQIEILQDIDKEPFFRTVWSLGNVALYNNPEVWERFGYEGASFTKGGYIARGFDDLSWLPRPTHSTTPRR